MTSGLKTGTAILALFAGIGLSGIQANAADLGGNCCADLEERIAELESTTARKGNRKVSLEISGHVNETLIFWDDGVESNAGVYTNDNSRSRFRVRGSAAIADGVKAGYLIEIGVRSQNSKRFSQTLPGATTGDNGLDVRHSAWFVESKNYGTLWLGRTGPAAEGITEINLANTKDVAKFSDIEDSAGGLLLRSGNGPVANLQWRRLIGDSGDQPGETERGQIVKYVSPGFEGFSLTAAWGGDDYWDIGMNYKGEFAGFKLAAGIAYGEESNAGADADGQIGNCNRTGAAFTGCQQVGGSVSLMHEDTGLYGNFAAGYSQDESIVGAFDGGAAVADDESSFYAFEAGIQRRFIELGNTTIFGQYYRYDGGSNDHRDIPAQITNGGTLNIQSSEVEMYGGGLVQELGSSNVLLYAYYRHLQFELNGVENAGVGGVPNVVLPLNDIDMVVAGGMIKF